MARKISYITIAAALLLVGISSCTINEEHPVGSMDVRISFNAPVTGRPETKIVTDEEIGREYDTRERFAVWAVHASNGARSYYIGTETAGVTCVYKGSAPEGWYPVDSDGSFVDYYWPYQGTLDFRALSPADVSGTVALELDGTLRLEDFTVPDAGKQYDLMVSDFSHGWVGADLTGGDNDDDSIYKYRGVDILFRHALCRVEFRGRLASGETGSDVSIKNVVLSGLCDSGTLTVNDALGWSDIASSVSDGFVSYEAFSGDMQLEYKSDGTSTVLKSHTLMLMPQFLSRGDGHEDKVCVSITFSKGGIESTVTETLYGLLGSEGGVGVSKAINEWLPGRKYVYTFVIGEDRMFFDPTVVDFKDWGGDLIIK